MCGWRVMMRAMKWSAGSMNAGAASNTQGTAAEQVERTYANFA
jgi:hypothetical protein